MNTNNFNKINFDINTKNEDVKIDLNLIIESINDEHYLPPLVTTFLKGNFII